LNAIAQAASPMKAMMERPGRLLTNPPSCAHVRRAAHGL
jgi:hypothetical protein